MSSGDDKSDKVHIPSRRPTHGRHLPPDFMTYTYPTTAETARIWRSLAEGATEESKRCVSNLLQYRAVRTRARLPRGASAAVLVPLFVGRSGELYVLLSRRSEALRAFAGDTALPGGKVDAQDGTVEETARREAFEEIGLPWDRARVPLLCVMEPHLAKNEILVTPVVVLILDHTLQPNLNASEVTSIFAQPLLSFLSSTPFFSPSRIADSKRPYHAFTDLPWSDGGAIRLHRFLTGRESEGIKPVFGLTAAILIKTATIGYGRTPDFEVEPPNAPTSAQQIAYALLTPANPLRRACEREGVDPHKAAARLLRPPVAAKAPRTRAWVKMGQAWRTRLEGAHKVDPVRPGPEEDGQERVGERRDTLQDLAKLGYLDETRDGVNARMNEVKGDERKLAKARRGYPRRVEQVKEQMEGVHNRGDVDPKALVAQIPKEDGRPEDGVKVGKNGIKAGEGEGRDQATGNEKDGAGLGQIGKAMDACPRVRKHDAKL